MTAEDGFAIEMNGITRRFGAFTAVDRVTLKIPKGHLYGFLGLNGAGKTTTIRMLTTLLPPTSGTAKLWGYDVVQDTLEVRKPQLVSDGAPPAAAGDEGQLYRNGRPITGAAAFGKNSRKDGLYPGYTASGLLDFGQVVHVPAQSYFAMGDNSPKSKDSRYWGFVPEKEVVGRPIFIYYPLTSRWGPAK